MFENNQAVSDSIENQPEQKQNLAADNLGTAPVTQKETPGVIANSAMQPSKEPRSLLKKIIIFLLLIVVLLLSLLTAGYFIQKKQIEEALEEWDSFDVEIPEMNWDEDSYQSIIPDDEQYHDLYSSVEKMFVNNFADYDYKINYNEDESNWWITEDGMAIFNNNPGIVTTLFENERYDLMSLGLDLRGAAVIELDRIMDINGFQKDSTNSDKSFNHYRQAYDKGDTKCLFSTQGEGGEISSSYDYETDSDSIDYSFFCFNNFEGNYNFQKPFIEDLGLAESDSYISSSKIDGDYAYLNINGTTWFSGHYMLVKKVNGKWTEISAGQDSPMCEELRAAQVPEAVWEMDDCYVKNGDEYEAIEYKL